MSEIRARVGAGKPIRAKVGAARSGSSDVTADQVRAWDAETLEAARLNAAASLAVYGEEVAATFASLIEFVQSADAETLLAAQTYADDRPAPSWYAVTGKPASFPPAMHYHRWVDIEDKPEQFEPLSHPHPITDVTGLSAALADKSPLGHTHDAATLVGLHAGLVGLGNVDNTRDAQKPVSTAQQAALDGKASTGQALPTGGTAGQVLTKTSGTNYATGWQTPSASWATYDSGQRLLNGTFTLTASRVGGTVTISVSTGASSTNLGGTFTAFSFLPLGMRPKRDESMFFFDQASASSVPFPHILRVTVAGAVQFLGYSNAMMARYSHATLTYNVAYPETIPTALPGTLLPTG